MRVFLAAALTLGIFLGFLVNLVYAKNETPLPSPTPTPTSFPIDSFELFWPLVAGKTERDPLYGLKLFKEQVRGWFIFDDTKRADYAVLLGTKRVLEAEEHIKNNDTDLALKSLDRADSRFSKAYDYIKIADSSDKFDAGEIRRDRLINVKLLIDYLKTVSSDDAHPGLDAVKDRADAMLRDYLP